VEDISDIVRGIKNPKEQMKLVKKKLKTLRSNRNYRIESIPGTGVTYITPFPDLSGLTDVQPYTRKNLLIDVIDILSFAAIASVNDMIVDQTLESIEERRKNSSVWNRL